MTGAADLVCQRPEGLYCPAGDFYIDPWQPVGRADITHADSDAAAATDDDNQETTNRPGEVGDDDRAE